VRELAHLAQIDSGYLSQVELGTKRPTRRLLERLAPALDINPNILLRHIHLLRMDYTKPAMPEDKRKLMEAAADLTDEEVLEVHNYIYYLKLRREVEHLAASQQSSKNSH